MVACRSWAWCRCRWSERAKRCVSEVSAHASLRSLAFTHSHHRTISARPCVLGCLRPRLVTPFRPLFTLDAALDLAKSLQSSAVGDQPKQPPVRPSRRCTLPCTAHSGSFASSDRRFGLYHVPSSLVSSTLLSAAIGAIAGGIVILILHHFERDYQHASICELECHQPRTGLGATIIIDR